MRESRGTNIHRMWTVLVVGLVSICSATSVIYPSGTQFQTLLSRSGGEDIGPTTFVNASVTWIQQACDFDAPTATDSNTVLVSEVFPQTCWAEQVAQDARAKGYVALLIQSGYRENDMGTSARSWYNSRDGDIPVFLYSKCCSWDVVIIV